MAVTPASLYRRARGAFDGVDEDCVQDAIDEACRYVSEIEWGSRFDDGVFYLACHILAEAAQIEAAAADGGAAATGGAVPAGPISSESILSWRASYAVSEGGVFDDAFATTTWGRQYLARCHRVFSRRVL
jgi:hypothetical protein